ncbi:YhcB family protein [Halomonas sp. M4R1S46]|uniref:YhcB family protein n=1 Tax=Halomonas sp. M4R1S46 TaxID=2982692 RepID=UPI0021E372EF|nr:YhcB family protein [Halomonas sp. M4R1S46]UYG08857.1 YhcB family protein [Halomonas sp. M4R1S46]
MEESNINWVLAIACLLAGVGIGALGYRLLDAGAGNVQRLRQRLAERDRQLAELRDGLGEHLERVGALTEALNRDGQALHREMAEASATLGATPPRKPDLTPSAPPDTGDGEDSPAAPRDYADGNRGTLSEDFGLKPGEASTPQPPRY